jgi:hypothetical protein
MGLAMADSPNSAPQDAITAYVSTFLDTPARIVAENATHFVFALTLPKKLLRNNHGLLAALSNIAGE